MGRLRSNRRCTIETLIEKITLKINAKIEKLEEQYDNLSERQQDGMKGESIQDDIGVLHDYRDMLDEVVLPQLALPSQKVIDDLAELENVIHIL